MMKGDALRRGVQRSLLVPAGLFLCLLSYIYYPDSRLSTFSRPNASLVSRCRALQLEAGPPQDFHDRTESDRYVPGTRPHLIQNAKLWTGGNNGTEVFSGDILIDKGLIKGVGHFGSASLLETYGSELVVIDAENAWVTPGIVDIHSHLGDSSSPELEVSMA
ncbi:hypothetical protein B0H13DRAFT_575972 [Mycena leptocephala]|nr:hypothetical protein B0H13DRAFT_575972 [Mycena leptocephala]